MKKNIVRKLTSRKLWMSLASFVMNLLVFFGYTENTATQVAALIMAGATVIGYVIGEGLADSSTTLESCISELDTTDKPEE
nr:MAG TPA: holin [Caudoviricetes sp.]